MPEYQMKDPSSGGIIVAGTPADRALLLSRGYLDVTEPVEDKPESPPIVPTTAPEIAPGPSEVPAPKNRK
jgi:hypothetical protein